MGDSRRAEDADSALFLAEIQGSQPLGDRARVAPPRPASRVAIAPAEPIGLEVEDGRGRAAGVSRAQVAELAAGRIRPEVRLDLHGQSETAALTALERFVTASRQAGRRCVLVITGKGLHSEAGPILRERVPGWLAGRLAGHVRAFTPARPADGGDGAFYVHLSPTRSVP